MQFNTIRDVLQPLYQRVEDLENEFKYRTSRQIAVQYSGLLKERLYEYRYKLVDEDMSSKTSVRHLIWMCDQIVAHAGYVPDEWSVTKLHRWLGYIQGVMVSRGFTTVEEQREEYKKLKTKILEELKNGSV